MEYTIKAHPTEYKGVLFRSRLEARWAAFFDLAGWKWQYEPFDLQGWTPDFRVEFPCGHSECNGSHSLLVEVKPYLRIQQFDGHECRKHDFGHEIPADAGAAFGNDTNVTEWQMCHGAGGGVFDISFWIPEHEELWKQAGNITQYKVK